jgi:hypothetical protein
MAFFCNFCTFIPENKTTISLISEESPEKLGNEKQNKIVSRNNYIKLANKSKSYSKYSNKYSQEKDKNGNSIFDMKMPYICLFCGGEACKYENSSKEIKSDIDGLIANLYFDCIYASQRPCTKLIKKYDLIETFKQKNIKLIVNCQINGEHPYCGPNNGLEKDCGFSYSPSVFIAEGIEVLCKGFQDLTPPHTFNFMLDIVKRMAYVIKYKKGRVLVHCHAGNGRTGIVNVCFFIYYFNLSYNEALNEVRKLRKKGVEKPLQELYCKKFGEYIKDVKNLFPNKRKKIGNYIHNQNIMNYNFDKDKIIIPSIVISYYFKNYKKNIKNKNDIYKKIIDINFIPKLIFECTEKIIEQKIFNKINIKKLYDILNGKEEINEQQFQIEQIISQLKNYNWDNFEKVKDINIISEILFIWLNNNVISCISPQKIEKIINDIINLFLVNKENLKSKEETNKNNIKKLFERYINDYNKYKDEIKKILETIKVNLTKVEYEIIKYLSLFLQIIYPTNNYFDESNLQNKEIGFFNDMINEYKRFLYKLSLFLLGYNLDKINSYPDYLSPSNELLHSKMLIFIFELFIFYYNDSNISEPYKEEDIFFIYKDTVDFKSIYNNFI